MDEKYLYSAVRQVECNPVKAHLVSLPGQWKWSGARAHLQGKNDDIVDLAPMLERVEDWSAYSCSKNGDDAQMLRLHEHTGRPPGSNQFVDKSETPADRTTASKARVQVFIILILVQLCPRISLRIANWLIQYLDFSIDSGTNICHYAKQIQQ